MKTLLIIVCCILLINWGFDGHSFHMMNIHWNYDFPHSIMTMIGSVISFVVSLISTFAHLLGFVLALGILIYIGSTFGIVGFIAAAGLLVFASTLLSIVTLFWPILIIVGVILLCSSKRKRHYY
jgi:hypothetical protein